MHANKNIYPCWRKILWHLPFFDNCIFCTLQVNADGTVVVKDVSEQTFTILKSIVILVSE